MKAVNDKADELQSWPGQNPNVNTSEYDSKVKELCGKSTTTKGPSGLTTSHPTQMVTTLGHSPLLVLVETITAT